MKQPMNNCSELFWHSLTLDQIKIEEKSPGSESRTLKQYSHIKYVYSVKVAVPPPPQDFDLYLAFYMWYWWTPSVPQCSVQQEWRRSS